MASLLPFTIYDARVALYREGETQEMFVGACIEKLTLSRSFSIRRVERPGSRYATPHQDDEEHEIDLGNTWLWRLLDGSADVPLFQRGEFYRLVVVWWDEEAQAWAKRTYFDTVLSREGVDGDSVAQQGLRFVASYYAAEQGATTEPSLLPTVPAGGVVRYAYGGLSVNLWSYDPGTRALTELRADVATFASISTSAGVCSVRIGGVLSMRLDSSAVHVSAIKATGGTYASGVSAPRLEIYSGLTRVGTLVQGGTLAVPRVAESAFVSDGTLDFWDGSTWLGGFAPGVFLAAGFKDDL